MGDKVESEHSYGSDSSSTSDSSSGSSEGEEDVLELVRILGQTLELPQELCEDYGVFKEFFSMKTWDALSEENKEHLKQYLPKFPGNDEEEKETTIKMLFNHEPFHFTTPFGDFFDNLRQGNYRPDIAKMRSFLKKARAKQQKHRMKAYYAKLLPEVLISRERLLAVAKALPPGPIPTLPILPPRPSTKNNYKPMYQRAKQRYFEELAAIRSEVGGEESEDENYPDGPPVQAKRKKQSAASEDTDSNVSGTLGGIEASSPTSLECLKNVLAIHRARRQYRENHPELNTVGITLEDIKQRVALVNGAKKIMFGGPKGDGSVPKLKRGPKKDSGQKAAKSQEQKGVKRIEEPMDSVETKPLLPNIKLKCEPEESDSESSSFVDPVASPSRSKRIFEPVEIKQEVIDNKYPCIPNINYNDPKLESVIKQEPPDVMPLPPSRVIQHVPIKLEDLDGIDMMALPVEIADDSGEVLPLNSSEEVAEEPVVDPDEALTETTHANFLSLVRALFPARAAHRASKQQLHARCIAVMRSPIAPLNTWYSLSDDWCAELDSALSFLAGERGPHPDDFVPYLQFMPETQMYQWIGAGRDCDALLGRLCERWLHAASPPPPLSPRSDPPPPRYPTSWTVRPATTAEIVEFRAQERKRFASAAKPFTYVQHGYQAVVGACVRGGAAAAAAAAGAGAGAGLLCGARPRHATLAALVRDALARLPNGEGTRHDVLTLLKMSQWIAPCTDQVLLSAVSAALEKLLSAKRDPVVKYDQRTAIWTYLHRHRSEEDWIKSTGRGRGSKAAALAPPPPPPPRTHNTSLHAMDMEVASVEEVIDNGSDTDVDVDDSSVPSSTPQLSSAQLLMQATQTQAKLQTPQGKSKGKLVAISPTKAKTPKQPSQPKPAPQKPTQTTPNQPKTVPQPKPSIVPPPPVPKAPPAPKQSPPAPKPPPPATKPTPTPKPTLQAKHISTLSPKQANMMNQAVKQASLMAQSAKQANVIAQLTKQAVAKSNLVQSKQVSVVKQSAQSPKQTVAKPQPKPVAQTPKTTQVVKQEAPKVAQIPKSSVVPTPHKSPLLKQRPLQKQNEVATSISTSSLLAQQVIQTSNVIQTVTPVMANNASKQLTQGTRSLLIRAPAAPAPVASVPTAPVTQVTPNQRRGIVRVLSPAAPSAGKSLISPRALLQQSTPTTKKRVNPQECSTVNTVSQTAAGNTTVVSSVPTAVSAAIATRTVQLSGGRTVQLAANQTVTLPGGQAVQLTAGHTLQLSSLQLPTHSVRLPSGQTVQLASPQTIRAVSKPSSPRTASPTVKPPSTLQIPISSVQLAGQTVQIGGQTVQLAGQSVQLTGHTVKLPSGQSVQVAGQSVMPPQSVQLPSGQTVQLGGSVQTVQLGPNVLGNPAPGTVQLSGQTVQLAGQTVQLAGPTVQLPGGQTLQLSSGQTIQLAGQTVHLANQGKAVRSQAGEKSSQPIVAKLLTNTQGQMISLEGGVGVGGGASAAGAGRALQVSGVRVLSPARGPRPLLLTAAKPLHNVILQQGDGSTIRMTSSGGAATSQTIVLSNIGAQNVATSTSTPPVLKLQQAPGGVGTASGVRSVVMDAQQLKLVGGRHVLARILRPAQPPHTQPQ